jgi:hypothetical protein
MIHFVNLSSLIGPLTTKTRLMSVRFVQATMTPDRALSSRTSLNVERRESSVDVSLEGGDDVKWNFDGSRRPVCGLKLGGSMHLNQHKLSVPSEKTEYTTTYVGRRWRGQGTNLNSWGVEKRKLKTWGRKKRRSVLLK